MNFLKIIDWILNLKVISFILFFGTAIFGLMTLYKKSNYRIILARKDNYFKIRELLLVESLKDNDFKSLINVIYKDMESVSIDKDIYIKKIGGAIQQIGLRLGQQLETITNLEDENKNLKNRSVYLEHRDKLNQLIILLEDIRKFKEDDYNHVLNHIESNLILILSSFGVSEYTTEFLNDEILKYYIFDKEPIDKDSEEFIIKKSGFYIERLDGITVLKAAVIAVMEG